MANRSELSLIRAARAGQAAAQLMLGRRYLFGGAGLPKNLATALYWLDRAAHQDEKDAWLLIGSHVPFETVQQTMQPSKLYVWYERAFDAGIAQAGLVLARLVLEQVPGAVNESMRNKALRALQAAAHAGIAEAQWMLARHIGDAEATKALRPGPPPTLPNLDNEAMLEWATRAAQSGIVEARYALADHAWASADRPAFLKWALPLARSLVNAAGILIERDAGLVARCAHALYTDGAGAATEAVQLWEHAAHAGDRGARFSLGLHYARMDANGRRTERIAGVANYKKAMRWLSLAGEQGVIDAWYVLSKIYLKPECSQRSVADAQRYLERAAQAGHGIAQLEFGTMIWRTRRDHPGNDLRALYWLQKALAQGVAEAATLIEKIAARAAPAPWARAALQSLTHEARDAYPLLSARIELAARFGLSRTEALLIEPTDAICGDCLVVDIHTHHAQRPHGSRRLILVRDAEEREALDRIARLFEGIEPGPDGPEGNYRRRLYRLKTLLPD
jgi:TPR repeat protein